MNLQTKETICTFFGVDVYRMCCMLESDKFGYYIDTGMATSVLDNRSLKYFLVIIGGKFTRQCLNMSETEFSYEFLKAMDNLMEAEGTSRTALLIMCDLAGK